MVLLLHMRRLGRSTLASVRRVTAVGLTLVCTAAVGISTSAADTGDDGQRADQQVRQLEDALEGTSTEFVAAYQAWQATAAQLSAAQTALADAQAKEKAATEHYSDVAGRLAVAGANEARAVEVLRSNAGKLQETQSSLDNFAADMFQGGGGSQLSVALGSVGAHDFATRVVLADQVSSLTKTALQDLQTIRATGTAQEAYLRAVRAEVADLVTQAEAALTRAASARRGRAGQGSPRPAARSAGSQHEGAQRPEGRRGGHAGPGAGGAGPAPGPPRRAGPEGPGAEAARAEAARAANQSYTPPSGGIGFLSDPANAPITSEFGQRFHPILRIWKLHSGTDFGVPCGTPVYATADGTVVSAGWGGGDGNRTVIDHGILSGVDLMTAYNHLSSFVVQSGPVKRGQLIAYSGTTGYSTGCHLHFETLENGSFVNPRKWI